MNDDEGELVIYEVKIKQGSKMQQTKKYERMLAKASGCLDSLKIRTTQHLLVVTCLNSAYFSIFSRKADEDQNTNVKKIYEEEDQN